ncbi:MAG TPA: hypothetical protein VGP05_18280 [Pseudonocardia sp.]|nr:hypothetical protein [Pseudonocardia sp.]
MATTAEELDRDQVGEFARRIFSIYTNGLLPYMIDPGNRTGLFAAAACGPASAATLSERAGIGDRYVREWLGAVVTGGIMTYEPAVLGVPPGTHRTDGPTQPPLTG